MNDERALWAIVQRRAFAWLKHNKTQYDYDDSPMVTVEVAVTEDQMLLLAECGSISDGIDTIYVVFKIIKGSEINPSDYPMVLGA